jgi:hypothetical protein
MAERRAGDPSEVVMGMWKEEFLRADFQAKDLDELIAPELIFDNFIPKETVSARAFTYFVESISSTRKHAGTDPRKEYVPPRASGAEFAYVTVSPLEQKTGALKSYGVAFKLDEDALTFSEGVDPLSRTRNRVAYWIAEQINTEMVTAMTNTFSVTNTDDTAMEDVIEHSTDFGVETTIGHLAGVIDDGFHWDQPDGDPVTDMLDLQAVFNDQDGYSYRMTDVWLRFRDWNLINKYVMDIDAEWQTSPNGGYETNALHGLTFHPVQNTAGFPTTVGDGYILCLDRSNPAGTTYQTFYPQYPKTDNMNYHSYVNDETHDTHYQFWFTRQTVILEPLSMLVCKIRD